MILKASQRGGGQHLAAYLLHYSQNEHIELLDMRGFVNDNDLSAALAEIEAQAQSTRCRKMFFSVSFNPPPDMDASLEQFEDAIKKVEERFGLESQARAAVLHIKKGRRHVHVAWSLIDHDKNRALKVGMYKNKLMDLSRDLYRENGWEIPRGIQQDRKEARRKGQKIDRGQEDNYTTAEKRQAERAGRDPKEFKRMVKDLYEMADTRHVFEASLAEKGLFLARGSRAFLIVDATGHYLNLTKIAGRDQKELRERLGDEATLPTVEQVQDVIRQRALDARFKRALSDLRQRQAKERNLYRKQLTDLDLQHRNQHRTLQRQQGRRNVEEERARGQRLRGGIMRMFDKLVSRVTGEETRTQKRIGLEREQSRRRDLREKDELHKKQRLEREQLKWGLRELERNQQKEIDGLREAIVQDIEREGGTIRDEARNRKRQRDDREERQEEREDGLGREFKKADRDRSEEKDTERDHETERNGGGGRDAPERPDDRGPKLER